MSKYRVVLRSACGDPLFDQWLDRFADSNDWSQVVARATLLRGAGYQGISVQETHDERTWTEIDKWWQDVSV